nr:hypothetical protein [uncultured Granulicatella sp.]
MKKVLKLVAILFSAFLIVGCSKPKITKEQQDNIAVRIYRNYDIQEIEFLSFTKNESTGTYNLRIKLNKDEKKETILVLNNLNILEKSEGKMSLDPLEKFEDIRRPNIINDKLGELNIKITYIGEK